MKPDGAGVPERVPRRVSIIVPVRDSARWLPRQLAALAGQRCDTPWELVVVDNGSVDGSGDVARSWSDRLPAVAVVEALERRSITYARNAGVAASRGDLLAFCDADDEVAPGWLTALVRESRGWDMVGGWIDERTLNDVTTLAWRPPWLPADRLPILLDFLPFAWSSNCAIWADVLAAVGGWNEEFHRGCTDVELSWRVQLAGYRLGFAPDAVVRYRYRPNMRDLARQFHAYGRSEPRVYRSFRRRGLRRSNTIVACLSWGWLALTAIDLARGPVRRGVWLRKAAYRAGRLRGSLEQRVLFL